MDLSLSSVLDWLNQPVVISTFSVVFGTLVANYFVRQAFRRLAARAEQTKTVWDDALVRAIGLPASLLVWVLGISYAAEIISAGTESDLEGLIDPVRYVAVVLVLIFFSTRFIRECEAGFIQRGADITTAQAVGKLLRVSVFITGALTILQTLGVSISGVLAFGGIGGIAVGFAARDLLANFFGGAMIYLDQPFKVGDWVRSPDRDVEGTVEHIGWRLTVVRTFDRRPLYIPNAVFASIAIENPARMQDRRIYENIGIRYADIDRMAAIVADVKQMLIDDEDIETDDRTLIVNFNAFNASSIDFMVYTFTKTTAWVEFHEIKQRILLEIAGIIERHGAEIAFPTRTLHLESPEPDPMPESRE